jgi:NAD(P)H-dependent flavin oxidoreductase YrpB (nitropropane dioxygenase family)
MQRGTGRERTVEFCRRFALTRPVLEATMAGANAIARAAAIADAGGMAGLGALFLKPEEIADWVAQFRARSSGALHINLWIPEEPPNRDAEPDAPKPAPYPVQRALTAAMRTEATRANDIDRMQAWAGQSAWIAKREPAAEFVTRAWDDAQLLLP